MGQGKDVHLPSVSTSLAEQLRDRLSVKGDYPDDVITAEGMRVPLPPGFRKPTTVVGTTLAKELEKLYQVAPEIRGRASVVSPGYTSGLLNMVIGSGDPKTKELLSGPPNFNILGLADSSNNELFVDENQSPKDTIDTLAHEYQHIMGFKGKGAEGERNVEATHPYPGVTGGIAGDLFYSPKEQQKKTNSEQLFNLLLKQRKAQK